MIVEAFISQLRSYAPVFGGRVAGYAEFTTGLKPYTTSMPLPAAYVVPLAQDAEPNTNLAGLWQLVHKGVGITVELDAQQDRRGQAPMSQFDDIETQIMASCLNLFVGECRMSKGTYFLGAHQVEVLDRARLFYQWNFGLDWLITDADGVQPDAIPLNNIELDIWNRPQPGDPPAVVQQLPMGGPPYPPPTDGPWPGEAPYPSRLGRFLSRLWRG